jgi:hypothetical protein
MSAIQFHQRKRIRHAKHDEEQDDANPERSRQLLRNISHVSLKLCAQKEAAASQGRRCAYRNAVAKIIVAADVRRL